MAFTAGRWECHPVGGSHQGLVSPAATLFSLFIPRVILFVQEVNFPFRSFSTFLKAFNGHNLGIRMKSGN